MAGLLRCRVEPLMDTQLLLHDQKPNSPSVPALPPQVFIQFVYRVNHQYYMYPKDSYRYIHLGDYDHQEIKQVVNTQFDLWMVDHSNLSYPLLSRKLSSVGVDPSLHSSVVDLITLNCKTSGYWQYCNVSGGWTVLPLSVTIEEAHYMILCEGCNELIGLEEEEEEEEEDDNDYEEVTGMIPSSELSIKELLKRVRVGNNEKGICTVCLEELSSAGGMSYAMEMPCKHLFHDECVVRWLKESHYCPICRFEMPTTAY
ncbi:hypothetical protein ACLB2K_042996 [Fragaria x ananassa]